jgi:microcystin-dependent protein
MSDPFLAEVRIFPFPFAPRGWALCNGQVLPISQNTALFSLLGTTYGGNGTSNYGLPNMQGNVPMHPGQGPGLSQYVLGETGGSPTVTLVQSQMPSHPHALMAEAQLQGNKSGPSSTTSYAKTKSGTPYQAANNAAMAPTAIGFSGSNQPHNNMMPYLTLNFCIALQGIFPPRG